LFHKKRDGLKLPIDGRLEQKKTLRVEDLFCLYLHGLYPQHGQYEQPEDGIIGPPQSGHTVCFFMQSPPL